MVSPSITPRPILHGCRRRPGAPVVCRANPSEYFTRAGTATQFWFGKTVGPQNANYDASIPYANGPRGERSKGPKPVDAYAPNPFGLYQVHGNVYEWTQEDTPADGSPWLEGDCSKRMARGGEWGWSANNIRSGAPTAAQDRMASA